MRLPITNGWGALLSRFMVPLVISLPFLQRPWNRLCGWSGGRLHYIYSPAHLLHHLQYNVSEEDIAQLIREQIAATDQFQERLQPGQPEVVALLNFLRVQLIEFPGPRNAAIWMQEVNKLQTTARWISDADAEKMGIPL